MRDERVAGGEMEDAKARKRERDGISILSKAKRSEAKRSEAKQKQKQTSRRRGQEEEDEEEGKKKSTKEEAARSMEPPAYKYKYCQGR